MRRLKAFLNVYCCLMK